VSSEIGNRGPKRDPTRITAATPSAIPSGAGAGCETKWRAESNAFCHTFSAGDDEDADRVSKVVRNVVTRLHAEISRSINFYRSQQDGSAPGRVLFTVVPGYFELTHSRNPGAAFSLLTNHGWARWVLSAVAAGATPAEVAAWAGRAQLAHRKTAIVRRGDACSGAPGGCTDKVAASGFIRRFPRRRGGASSITVFRSAAINTQEYYRGL